MRWGWSSPPTWPELGLVGSAVSGVFLLFMDIFNGSAFFRAAQAYRKAARGGNIHAEDLESKGLMARLLAKPLAKVERPRNIYVIGFLFGLGFDTAIENPQRQLGFNIVITGLSALSALFVAAITLGGLVNALGLDQPAITWLAGIDLGEAGLALVAVFAAVWVGAVLLGRRRAI